MSKTKPIIVVSAINLFEGGTLSILIDCLNSLNKNYSEAYNIIALVHKKNLFNNLNNITFYEYPRSRKSYIYRFYYEYFYFRALSKNIKPFLWISLHDVTPNIITKRQVVYCHNPSPFYKVKLKDLYFEPKMLLFSLFYRFIYEINITRNKYVIVQQNWMNLEFKERYKIKNVLTAYPYTSLNSHKTLKKMNNFKIKNLYTFFFPAIARSFKNFEIIGETVKLLHNNKDHFKVILTINGSENRYSKFIFNKYSCYKEIDFIGKISRNEVYKFYDEVDCLIFPSKLETWGLPISEFKTFNKPILASDLPYAHETVADYDQICFFNPNSPQDLAMLMQKAINGDKEIFDKNRILPPQPDATNWKELLEILIKK